MKVFHYKLKDLNTSGMLLVHSIHDTNWVEWILPGLRVSQIIEIVH